MDVGQLNRWYMRQTFDKELAKDMLSALRTQQHPSFPALLTGLINELAQRDTQAVLVLEDFDTVDSPDVIGSLSFLLDHLPLTLHLVLISRGTPVSESALALPLLRFEQNNNLVIDF